MPPHVKANEVRHKVWCDLLLLLPWSSQGLWARVAGLPHAHAIQEVMVKASTGMHTRGPKPKRGNRGKGGAAVTQQSSVGAPPGPSLRGCPWVFRPR